MAQFAFTYNSFSALLAAQIPTTQTDPNFLLMLPAAIGYAEQIIYRDIDFLASHGTVNLGATSISNPIFVPPPTVVLIETLTSGGVQYLLDENGNQIVDENGNPIITGSLPGKLLTPTTIEFIQAVYTTAPAGPPTYFAPIGAAGGTNWSPALGLMLGPTPDNTYTLTAHATQRETTLSADYPQTFISTNLPELFWAGSMIFVAGFMKNYGAQADDPRQALSWESEYRRGLEGVQVEEARKRFRSQGWSAQQPYPVSTPPRK